MRTNLDSYLAVISLKALGKILEEKILPGSTKAKFRYDTDIYKVMGKDPEGAPHVLYLSTYLAEAPCYIVMIEVEGHTTSYIDIGNPERTIINKEMTISITTPIQLSKELANTLRLMKLDFVFDMLTSNIKFDFDKIESCIATAQAIFIGASLYQEKLKTYNKINYSSEALDDAVYKDIKETPFI